MEEKERKEEEKKLLDQLNKVDRRVIRNEQFELSAQEQELLKLLNEKNEEKPKDQQK